jgi:hypothetical protein
MDMDMDVDADMEVKSLMHHVVLSSGLKIRSCNIFTGQPGHGGQNSQNVNPGQDC